MAVLEKIRNRAGLLVGVVGLALFAFVIGDFLRGGSTFFRQSRDKIAIVNGQSIDIQEFQQNAESAINGYKARAGGTLTEEQQHQVREMIFEELVGAILIDGKSKKIGFVVSNEELADLVMGNNISPVIQQYYRDPKTGTFDKNNFIQYLQVLESDNWSMYAPDVQRQLFSERENWLRIEKTVSTQKLFDKFTTLLSSAIVANSLDAKTAFNDNAVSVDFDFVSQSFSSIPDAEVEVTDSEIEKLYELRKDSHKRERAKVISYIAVDIVPSETDFAEVSKRIGKLKDELSNTANPAELINDNSDEPFTDAYVSAAQLSYELRNFAEFASVGDVDAPFLIENTFHLNKILGVKQAPDSIKFNQLVFPNTDEAKVKSITDSLAKVIRSGKSFADVALEETNGQTNGDMNWQTEISLVSQIDSKFANALFDAKINEIFTINSMYGIHFVQVVEKTKPVKKYKIGTIKIEVVPSQETYNKLYNSLNQYIAKNNKLEQFKSAATDAGYPIQTYVELYEGQTNIASIGNSRQVIRWAYDNKKGTVSEIFECQDYFVVAAVEGEFRAGPRLLREISDILKRELINERKGAKIIASLKEKNLNSLDAYAEAMDSSPQEVKFLTFATSRITTIGVEPMVNVKAISSEVGRVTTPFAGKNAVYVLSVTAKNTGEQEYNETTQKRQMNMQNSYRMMSLVQNNSLLRDKATVEDYRNRFY